MEEDKQKIRSNLKQVTLDFIREITGAEFTMPILVRELNPIGYSVGIEVQQYNPTWYSAELPYDEYVEFLKKQLCQAKFLKVEFRKAIRNTTLDHRENPLMSPYDERRVTGKD